MSSVSPESGPGEFSKLDGQSAGRPPAQRTPSTGASRFRVIGGVVRALQRWQNALNPTYEFGSYKEKMREEEETRHQRPPPAVLAKQQQGARVQSSPAYHGTLTKTGSYRPRADSSNGSNARTQSGRPREPGFNHGHKAQMLFKPLPASTTVS